jgi:protein-S-isoprenylcysteine O-methyltransferase Ste14
MPWLETRVPPPVILLIAAALMYVVKRLTPGVAVPAWLHLPLTGLLIMCGIAISVAGVLEFRRSRTTVNPLHPDKATVLVTEGIFRFTRNPMYLGMLLVLCGWALYLASPLSLLGPVVFVAYMNRFQVIPEERAMREKFGDQYAGYLLRVRRWL